MSTSDKSSWTIVDNLAQTQSYLGDRLGRDVFIYSVTTDPGQDTPQKLADFAQRHGAQPGWLFLTGEQEAIRLLWNWLFPPDSRHQHLSAPIEDCSVGMVRYGNEAVGLWAAFPGITKPEAIAMRISWLQPTPACAGPAQRKGPLPPPATE
jgi:protein SCO1/2